MVPVTPNNFFFYRPKDKHDVLFGYELSSENPVLDSTGRPLRDRFPGGVIRPEAMFTSGASVPRFLWSMGGLSPFDYTRAALIHDWLYEAHHRYEIGTYLMKENEGKPEMRAAYEKGRRLVNAYQAYSDITQDQAADVYAECIKTIMEQSHKIDQMIKADMAANGNQLTESRMKEFRESLQDARPDSSRLWKHWWFTKDNGVVGTAKSKWLAKHDDLGVYERLSSDVAVKEGFMSAWLQRRFKEVYQDSKYDVGTMAGVSEALKATIKSAQSGRQNLTPRVYLEVSDAESQEALLRHAGSFGQVSVVKDKNFSTLPAGELKVYYYQAEDAPVANQILKSIQGLLAPDQQPKVARTEKLRDGGLFRPGHFDLHVASDVAKALP